MLSLLSGWLLEALVIWGEEEEILVSLTFSDFLFTGPPGSPPRSSIAMSEAGALLAFSE